MQMDVSELQHRYFGIPCSE